MEIGGRTRYVRRTASRNTLSALVLSLGVALIALGWVLEDEGYLSELLLAFGSTLVLVVPLIYVERSLSRQIGEVRDELEDLRRRSQVIATTYEQIRESEDSGARRTMKLEEEIRRARRQAASGDHSAADVAELFMTGTDGERIAALGMMQGDHSLANVDALVNAIEHSRSAFEQWHALVLARDVWDRLNEAERAQVLAAIDVEIRPRGYLRRGTDRYELARQIIARARPRGHASGGRAGSAA